MIQSIIKLERCYIGSAINIKQRWDRHLQILKEGRHHSKKLQNHYNKYGKNDLIFSILSGCTKEDLLSQEQFFIDSYNPYFNIAKIAGSPLGCKHSEETKRKMSIIAKNRPPISEETRAKLSMTSKGRIKTDEERRKRRESLKGRMPVNKGRKHSEETKRKISEWHKGKCHSEEAKRKIGEASRNRNTGSRHPNYGKKWSEEARRKMSESHKNISEETRQKMRMAGKRRIFTDELKRKLSLGHTGKKQSQETIQKRIQSVKLYYENKRKTA